MKFCKVFVRLYVLDSMFSLLGIILCFVKVTEFFSEIFVDFCVVLI